MGPMMYITCAVAAVLGAIVLFYAIGTWFRDQKRKREIQAVTTRSEQQRRAS